MDVVITVVLFLLGIVLIVKGGDFFVDAAAWIAEVSGIPKLIIGATIVSVATTLPEMLVSIFAAVEGKVDMSVGNAVGSVTANIGLIMAISLLFMPGVIKRRDYLPKSLLMLGAAGITVIGGLMGQLNAVLAMLLLLVFVVFIVENIQSARKGEKLEKPEERVKPTAKEVAVNIAKFVLGAVGIVVGADLLVDNGSELAALLGVSERIIGVTVVAIGTSLPELVTTITAIAKKQSSLSVGNILGANIMDLALIMPLSMLVSGKALPFAPTASVLDLPACLLVGAIAVVPALISSKFSRWQGVLLLAVYIAYVALTCTWGATLTA